MGITSQGCSTMRLQEAGKRHHRVQDAPWRDGRRAEGPTKPRPGREDLECQAKEFSHSHLPKEPENEKVLRDRGDHVCTENRTKEDSPIGRPRVVCGESEADPGQDRAGRTSGQGIACQG